MAKRGRKGKGQRTAAPPADARVEVAAADPAPEPATSAGHAELAAPATASAAPAGEQPLSGGGIAPALRGGAMSGRARALASAAIAAFLLFQIAMPLRYYLGGRGYDERFSWRMFSSVRMQNCKVSVNETLADGSERDVELARELQVAWIGMLERYRAQVVEKLLQRRCAVEDVREVSYARSCKDTDGSELPALHAALDCAGKTLRTEERAQ